MIQESKELVSPKDSIEWSRSKLIGFRFVFVFSLLAIAETYEPWSVVPYVGRFLSTVLDDVLTKIATAAAIHLFHVSGIAATSHATDSRDTALSWVTMLLIAATSAVATAIWSVVDRRRRNHVTAAVWLRYLVRIALIFIMLRYGIFKVFPLQMSRPSLGVLNEPSGQSSPMTLLWTLIGLKPSRQIASGLMETACELLLVFRRTALIGTLVGIVVMANVALLTCS